jgi:glycosyltransferase involved in cell wall biosynthesis
VLEKIKQDQYKNKVFFLDTVPWKILADYTASADLGIILAQNVCMNVYFSLPNKLFEYLSAGLPVVCSNFPEFQKIVVNDGVGLAVDPTNPHAIADAINKILDDPILYQQMSENAKKAVTEKYNWELEGEKLLQIYQHISN